MFAWTDAIQGHLRKAGHERQAIEIAMEAGAIDAAPLDVRDAVEG